MTRFRPNNFDTLFPWLHFPALSALLAELDRDGEEARVVGGAVRNALLGEPVIEWDIATTATPDIVTQRSLAAGWKVVPTGIDHGTVTVVVDHHTYEVTTLREDVETDGRHAVVRFGRDFRTDAFRRDFTINALSVTRDGTVHDYADGAADIVARRVRFIGEADKRIAEDYLRIFRLFRFHARYADGPLDRDSLLAAIRGRAGIERLSRERIHAELLKLLVARRGPQVVTEIDNAGFLAPALAGVSRLETLARMAASEKELGLEADPIRRLAALTLFTREDAARVIERLRLSNAQSRRLDCLAKFGETIGEPPGEKELRILLYRLKRLDAHDHLLLSWARTGDVRWRASLALALQVPLPVLPFAGADVTKFGIAPGPRIGEILAEAERRWIVADFPAKPKAMSLLDEVVRESIPTQGSGTVEG